MTENEAAFDRELAGMRELQAVPVLPYTVTPQCPKCGALRTKLWVALMPSWLRWLAFPNFLIGSFSLGFCRGQFGPTHEVSLTVPGPAESGGLQQQKLEVEMVCAGISEQHLHIHCGTCNNHFLMQTADSGR